MFVKYILLFLINITTFNNSENNEIFQLIFCFLHSFFFFYVQFNYFYYLINLKIQEFIIIILFGFFFPNWLIKIIEIILFWSFYFLQTKQIFWFYYVSCFFFSLFGFSIYFVNFYIKKKPLNNPSNLRMIKLEIRLFLHVLNSTYVLYCFDGLNIFSLFYIFIYYFVYFQYNTILTLLKSK
jgi:hypothetical protein